MQDSTGCADGWWTIRGIYDIYEWSNKVGNLEFKKRQENPRNTARLFDIMLQGGVDLVKYGLMDRQ